MNIKPSLLAIPALNVALLAGCTVTTGSSSRAVRIAEEQCASAENKVRQLQEELKLADKRAELEKQKREFAEERLKKQQKAPDEPQSESPDAAEDESEHGS